MYVETEVLDNDCLIKEELCLKLAQANLKKSLNGNDMDLVLKHTINYYFMTVIFFN